MAHEATSTLKSVTGWMGRRVLRLGTYPLDLSIFIFHVVRDWIRRGHIRDRTNRHETLRHVLQGGADPLPAILLLGLSVGFTFAAPLLMLSPQFAEEELAPLLLRIIGLELGPLLTTVVLIGRTGRVMAIELANMKLHGEARGLERLGVNLNDFFTAPRLIGTSVAQLVLATYFMAVAIFGGMVLAGLLYRGNASGLAAATLAAVETGDLLIFILKNLLFGLIVAGAACYSALQVEVAPTEVPQRAQQAATNSLLLVFVINGLITVLSS